MRGIGIIGVYLFSTLFRLRIGLPRSRRCGSIANLALLDADR